ncbi:MAG: hypothetical protein K8T91_24985 [Planctomycetes bacterium]|nr:hypothetical protein [Planctomycetota bacterium]
MPWKKHSPGCGCCALPCNGCVDGTTPTAWQVVFAGITDTIPSCPECVTLRNGTFILEHTPDWTHPFSSYECSWAWLQEENSCAFNGSFGPISLGISSGFITVTTALGIISWRAFVDFPLECNSVSGVVLPFLGGGGQCNYFGSTATVTAIP